jgi:hypothetical protein
MNGDEVEMMRKEAVVAYSRYDPGICLEGLRKTAKHLRTAGIPAVI